MNVIINEFGEDVLKAVEERYDRMQGELAKLGAAKCQLEKQLYGGPPTPAEEESKCTTK